MKRTPTHFALVVASALATLSSLDAAAAKAADLTVFAAASLTNVLQELGTAYETSGGDHVVYNFGASSTLARQIDEGAPADVFFCADEAKMDGLEKRGELVPGTRSSLLSNALVIVVAADSKIKIASPRDLTTSAIRVLALADPQTVPAGIYAKAYLRTAGVWHDVIDKVVPTENVRAALSAVEAGNAEAAIVYRTDAAISVKVRVAFDVPLVEAPKISYPVAVLKQSAKVENAKRFVDFLKSADGKAAFRRYGFIVPD
ncbi:MAG: molybdate ABC transporter substrate-binding protein [Acidobacteriota bacterium]